MVPAAIMGLDIARFLDHVEEMVHACAATVPVEENPGVVLGTILGVLAKHGRDKVTIITSPGIADFGAWLEQLLAESTGKDGKGLIPVDREPLGPPDVYGNDRMFVYLRLESAPDAAQDARSGGAGRGGTAGGAHQPDGPVSTRGGVVPLGNRHRGRRLDHRHQSLQPARRGSQQGGHPQIDRCV